MDVFSDEASCACKQEDCGDGVEDEQVVRCHAVLWHFLMIFQVVLLGVLRGFCIPTLKVDVRILPDGGSAGLPRCG